MSAALVSVALAGALVACGSAQQAAVTVAPVAITAPTTVAATTPHTTGAPARAARPATTTTVRKPTPTTHPSTTVAHRPAPPTTARPIVTPTTARPIVTTTTVKPIVTSTTAAPKPVASLWLSPGAENFPHVPSPYQPMPTLKVTVVNNGTTAMHSVVVNPVGVYSVPSSTCSSLEPGQSCSATIQFCPTAPGSYPAKLTVTGVSSKGTYVQVSIPLAGTAG